MDQGVHARSHAERMRWIAMDGEEFIEIADRLDSAHVAFAREHEPVLKRIGKAVTPFNKAWSGSNIGYHACIHFEVFSLPPTDARFSQEKGSEPS
ncbi:hypothetical protein [Methylobacterium fujisawaense]|uniref:hypothetical protein n=1 Tax=Methylobacterium fujisawaense TaxID=107400 RepID=UPI002F357793